MILNTPTNALDYKNDAVSLWRLMEAFIGDNELVPNRVSWQEDLTGMREAMPILWSPQFMRVAVEGARQLFEQGIDVPSGVLPKHGHWHMCGEPITPITIDGITFPIDSVLIQPIQRAKSGLKVIKVEALSSGHGADNRKPAIVAGFDWGVDLPLHQAVQEISRLHGDDPSWESEVRSICFWIMSAEIFLAQPVFALDRGHIERHTRKRIEKAGEIEPEVHVVRLRKFLNHEHSTQAEAKEVEWTCRWMVRGHWRQQWHSSTGKHETTWIMPHVKGPQDKPFRAPLPAVGCVVR